jgi:hypothetical protein
MFLHHGSFVAAAAALAQLPDWPGSSSWLQAAEAATPDLVHDTYNGLVAFVVPGPDAYSVAQGVHTPEPGGLDANIIDVFIATLDGIMPFVPAFSATVAAILNGVAQQVNPSAAGSFLSPFSRLLFAEKAAVFAVMDSLDPIKPISGPLPGFVALLAYSEAGVFDAATETLLSWPVGWTLSHYEGVADGRDEFIGYFENRRWVD